MEIDLTSAPVSMALEILARHDLDPETPARWVKALKEMTRGYDECAATILSKQFASPASEIVILKNIHFVSLCEHHVLPFIGKAAVGYLPNQRIAGLSKLARVVDCFARRLQVQERMTNQIANAVMENLDALGCGVIIEGSHQCMACRGVQKHEASMVTSVLRGNFQNDAALRAEFMMLAK